MEFDVIIEQMESARDQQLIDMVLSKDWGYVELHKSKFNDSIFNYILSINPEQSLFLFILIKIVPNYQTQYHFDRYMDRNTDYHYINGLMDRIPSLQTPENFERYLSLKPKPVHVSLWIRLQDYLQKEYYFDKFMLLNPPDEDILELMKECPKFQEWYDKRSSG